MSSVNEYRVNAVRELKDKVSAGDLSLYVDRIVPPYYMNERVPYEEYRLRAAEILKDVISDPDQLQKPLRAFFSN